MQYRAISRIYIGSPSLSAATASSAHIPAAGSQSTSSVCMNNPGCIGGRDIVPRGGAVLAIGNARRCRQAVGGRIRPHDVSEKATVATGGAVSSATRGKWILRFCRFEQPHPVQSKVYSTIFPLSYRSFIRQKKQQPIAGCCIPPGAAEDQKYLISLPSIAERILFAADDAPIRNRSVVSHSLPRISSTMV